MKKRSFLLSAVSLLLVLSTLAACATPTPEVIEKVVEKVVTQIVKETVKETVIVEGTPQVVEKEVTKVVEIEKEITKIVEVEKAPEEQVVVVAIASDPENMDQRYGGTGITTAYMADQIYNSLARLDKHSATYVPDLAASWDISEDGLIWTFHLRQGVKFHDGSDLTADDVQWTMDTRRLEQYGSQYTANFGNVESSRVIDDYTWEVTLIDPMALDSFFDRMAFEIYPEESGADPEGDFATHPIGTGPFKLTSWEKDVEVVLEAFDDYYQGRPIIDKVIWRIIPDATVRVAEMEAGTVDFVIDVSQDDVLRLQDMDSVNIYEAPGLNFLYVGLNVATTEMLGNKLVRQAIAHAIDKEDIAAIFPLAAAITHNSLPPTNWAYNPNVKTYEYDLDKAKALLAEAGYPDGFDITMKVTPDRPGVQETGEIVKASLAKIGINVELISTEFATFYADIKARNSEMYSLRWTGIVDPDFLRYIHHSESAGGDRVNYNNPEVDKLLEEAQVTLSREDRRQLYWQALEIIAEEVPYIPLVTTGVYHAYNAKLEGFGPVINAYQVLEYLATVR